MRKLFACGFVLLATAVAAPAAFGSNYVVLYKQQAVGSNAASTIARAGGTLVYSYPQIGVVIARVGESVVPGQSAEGLAGRERVGDRGVRHPAARLLDRRRGASTG
jgi:hypothetical protein